MRSYKPSRSFLIFTLVAGLVFLAGQSLRLAVANVYLEKALAEVTSLAANTENRAPEHFQVILKHIETSLWWRSKNARALSLQGEILYRYWWYYPDAQFPDSSVLLTQAIQSHRQALQLRPRWPWSHTELALIYNHDEVLGERFFKEFWWAYEKGRYEPKTALALLKLGIQRWPLFNEKQHAIIVELANTSVSHKANRLLGIKKAMENARLLNVLCSQMKSQYRQKQICNKH